MAKQATKVKLVAPEFRVPQNSDEASDAIAKIGLAQRECTRIEADMNDELAKIKEKYERQALPFRQEIESRAHGVQAYCDAHRGDLTNAYKVKFVKFASGEINWRTRPPRVVIKSLEAVLQALKLMKLDRFIRTKEEINKEAMLEEPDVALTVKGVEIKQGEDFVVKPFETELEAVV
jgi:phage host-nuclease inhibitor protein Gam